MTTSTSHYTMETTATYELKDDTPRRKTSADHHDPTDGSGSLTYSAASSINSNAGESTDSSFADIRKVLDGQESKELASFLKRHGKDEKSVADSLAYSTDAESNMRSLNTDGGSHLHGADYVSTITGQASDQNAYDGGNFSVEREESPQSMVNSTSADDILFAPAEATESLKQRKDRKRRERRDRRERKLQQLTEETSSTHSPSPGGMPAAEPTSTTVSTTATKSASPPTTPTAAAAASKSPSSARSMSSRQESRQGTPPPAPNSRPPKGKAKPSIDMADEDDVWYARWLMFCFPDTTKSMSSEC